MPTNTPSADHMEQNKRLDRIEDKLDKLSDAVVSLARAEEKISALMISTQAQSEVLIQLSKRVEKVEKTVDGNTLTINIVNKLFWVIIAAAAAGITGMFIS